MPVVHSDGGVTLAARAQGDEKLVQLLERLGHPTLHPGDRILECILRGIEFVQDQPKNAIGFEAPWPNSRRYVPPTRTSASQVSRDTPVDFSTHHCWSSSGLVHASNTMRARALNVRVMTSSRSDFRSIVVRFFMG
jgi:hypothetical protein